MIFLKANLRGIESHFRLLSEQIAQIYSKSEVIYLMKKLKIAFIRRSSEQGFAIPITVGLGLFMLLVATMMLVRSQGDLVTASAQKATDQALAAAETGITRYQAFIKNNSVIAVYPDCKTGRTATGACQDTTQSSWSNATMILGLSGSCSGGSNTTTSTISANSTTNWQDISSTNSSLGQYKLVSYTYTPNSGSSANTPPGIGTLTVEGRVNQVGSGSSATATVGTATTKLVVSFSISSPSATTSAPPGLWASNYTLTGGALSNANILDSSCGTSGNAFPVSHLGYLPSPPYAANTKAVITQKNVPFPPLPNNGVYAPPTTGNFNNILSGINLSGSNTMSFPRPGDVDINGNIFSGTPAPPQNATYIYHIGGTNSINLSGSSGITFGSTAGQGQEKIIVYADSPLNLTGGSGAVPSTYTNPSTGVTTTTKVIFYLGPSSSLTLSGGSKTYDPEFYQFYVYTTQPNQVTLTGNSTSYAFIFAPFTDTTLTGSASIDGTLWTKTFTASGSGSVNQGMVSASVLEVPLPSSSAQTSLATFSSWQRQSAN